jgi:hypothetical protein
MGFAGAICRAGHFPKIGLANLQTNKHIAADKR